MSPLPYLSPLYHVKWLQTHECVNIHRALALHLRHLSLDVRHCELNTGYECSLVPLYNKLTGQKDELARYFYIP